MTTDRIHLKDADEAWIAKYRAAVKEAPVKRSRSSKIRQALIQAHTLVFSRVNRILDRWLPARSQSSAQPPQTSVVPPQSASGAIAHAPTGGLTPLTGKALIAEKADDWREKPVA